MSEFWMHLKGIFDLVAKICIGFLFCSCCYILVHNLGFPRDSEIVVFVVVTVIIGIKLKMEIKWL